MSLKRIVSGAIVFALLSLPGWAGETRKAKIWRISMVVLGGATTADAYSSWGKREANPLLQTTSGQFGARSVALKASFTGAAMFMQWRLARKDPKITPYLATANFAAAAIFTGAAARALRTPSAK